MGSAEILVRVDRHVVHAHFVVKVGAGGSTRLAHVANDLSARNMLARYHRDCGEMTVDGIEIVPVIENNFSAIAVSHRSIDDVALRRCAHRGAIGRINIDAGVERAFAVEWIFTFAEAGSYAAFNGP